MAFFDDHGGDGELIKFRLYYLGLALPPATVALPVSSGSQTVTPSSMNGVMPGILLSVIDDDAPALGDSVAAALAGAGAGNVDNGAHSYLIVVNRSGGGGIHTGPSTSSAPLTVDDKTTNGKATITRSGPALPTGDTWDIYRTVAAGDPSSVSNFKLVNTSPLSASTTSYTDNTADASLGATAPTASNGGTNPETVTVTSVDLVAGTFTATFTLAHYAGWIFNAAAPLYWTDCDVDIEWNGHRWLAFPGIVPGQVTNQPQTQSASYKIADGSNTYFPLFASVNGGELALAAIYEAGFAITNVSPVPDQVVSIFSGRVDHATATTDGEDTIEIVLMPPVQSDAGELPSRLLSSLIKAYTPTTDTFTGDGHTVSFAASQTPVRTNFDGVKHDGVVYFNFYPGYYVIVGNVITFTTAPANGVVITWTYYK